MTVLNCIRNTQKHMSVKGKTEKKVEIWAKLHNYNSLNLFHFPLFGSPQMECLITKPQSWM